MTSSKPRKLTTPVVGTKALVGSPEARRAAAVVLECVTGLCTIEDASVRLGVAPPRYYVLETRALQGLIASLEPRARGRRVTEASRVAALERENTRLEREVRRYQALHRAATRAIGLLPVSSVPAENGSKKRRKRKRARAERVIASLRREEPKPVEIEQEGAP